MPTKKTIVFCPLNWGLGHATRMIPMIDSALLKGHTVIIASDGNALTLLQKQYPAITSIELPKLTIHYGKGVFAELRFLFSLPKIIAWIRKDYKAIDNLTKKYSIDLIISDNRWGAFSKRVKSIFITHQIMVKMPPLFSFFEKTVFALQHRLIRNFNEIWIPDSTNAIMNLSADLSHKYQRHTNTKYIGILSQFKKEIEKNLQHEYVIAVILSGPEPHRTLFEKEIIELIITLQLKSVIVGGTFSPNTKVKNNLISYIPFANTNELQKIYSQSTYIICRSGYTSLMDLIILRKPALLIPTPSQTEQEYLSKYVSERNWFKMIKQQDIKHITIQSLQQLEKMTLPYISTFNQKDFVF